MGLEAGKLDKRIVRVINMTIYYGESDETKHIFIDLLEFINKLYQKAYEAEQKLRYHAINVPQSSECYGGCPFCKTTTV